MLLLDVIVAMQLLLRTSCRHATGDLLLSNANPLTSLRLLPLLLQVSYD